MVQQDNTVAYCPKIMGIPECVDMATVAMATELGHMSMQMLFIRYEWQSAGRAVWKEKAQCNTAYNTDHRFCHSSSLMLSFLLSSALGALLYRLRAPPCGCQFPLVCLTLWTCGLSAQVLDWIENHGEAFLSKHTGVGKSLHRARALQKRHEDFEEVAQVAWFCFCNSHSILGLSQYITVLKCSHVKTADSQPPLIWWCYSYMKATVKSLMMCFPHFIY